MLATDLVANREEPYPIAREIHGEAMRGGTSKEGMSPANDQRHAMWLLWGSLTDWVENKPEETTEVEETMRRAPREWLEVVDDEARWRPYFDRWLYDEMGYERPTR